MKRFGPGVIAAVTLGLVGCQTDNKQIEKKLDDIQARLVAIEAKLGAAPGAGARPPAQPARAQPDPSAVYSVPVTGAATIGSPNAKVTLVEAFTFT